MIKNNQKRYEYNTNPINSHEKEHYKHKYTNNVLVHDYPFSSTTPINKANNHYGSQNQHHKINSSMTSVHENQKQNHKHQEKYEPRKRTNSASNVKRHEEKVMPHSKAKNFVFQQNYKNNNKKIYFGDDSYNDQFDTLYNKHTKQNKHAPRDERRSNNEEAESNVLQENVNHQNNSKKERNKEYVQYRNELKGYQASVQINQKEIFDKIGRINRINEEINNRLAKMLNKIDNV